MREIYVRKSVRKSRRMRIETPTRRSVIVQSFTFDQVRTRNGVWSTPQKYSTYQNKIQQNVKLCLSYYQRSLVCELTKRRSN